MHRGSYDPELAGPVTPLRPIENRVLKDFGLPGSLRSPRSIVLTCSVPTTRPRDGRRTGRVVAAHGFTRSALECNAALIEQDGSVADALDGGKIVRDEKQRHAASTQFVQPSVTLLLEENITD